MLILPAIAAALSAPIIALAQMPDPDDPRMIAVVSPSKQVTLGAPVNGPIAEIAVEEAQPVRADQPLARIDDEVQRLAVKLADLEIERQDMLLAESRLQLEQAEELRASDAINEWEYRRKKLQLDGAMGAVQRAEANHELEQTRLERHTIRAPFDGHILTIATEQGATLRQGDEILLMVVLDPLEARFDLPIEYYGKVHIGQEFELEPVDAPFDHKLRGRLKTIEPRINSATGAFRCVMSIPNPGSELPSGFKVRLIWPTAAASQ